jgi:glucose-6-phosphate isomerase
VDKQERVREKLLDEEFQEWKKKKIAMTKDLLEFDSKADLEEALGILETDYVENTWKEATMAAYQKDNERFKALLERALAESKGIDFQKDGDWQNDQSEILHFSEEANLDDLYVAYTKARETAIKKILSQLDSENNKVSP